MSNLFSGKNYFIMIPHGIPLCKYEFWRENEKFIYFPISVF